MSKKTLFIIICLLAGSHLYAQSIQKVYLHLNGYEGNLSYRTGFPNFQNYNFFYVFNAAGDTVINMESNGNYFTIDNGSYAGSSSFAIIKQANGHFVFSGQQYAATMVDSLDNGQIVPVITLQTSRVIINKSDLTIPYWFPAFELKKGQSNVVLHNYLYNDTCVTLIKGLDYRVGCTPGIPPNICMKYNCNDSVFADLADNEFYITLHPNGVVTSSNPEAASCRQNVVIFRTQAVTINPSFFRNASNNRVRLYFANDPYHFITVPTIIKVFKNLVNYIFWVPIGSSTEKAFIYREL